MEGLKQGVKKPNVEIASEVKLLTIAEMAELVNMLVLMATILLSATSFKMALLSLKIESMFQLNNFLPV